MKAAWLVAKLTDVPADADVRLRIGGTGWSASPYGIAWEPERVNGDVAGPGCVFLDFAPWMEEKEK